MELRTTRKKNILGFDNWTGGAHYFERLVTAFAEQGLELTLLHLGSWGNDVGRPKEEKIGSLRLRDISYYGQNDFSKILRLEKPDAVLFMSTDTFSHRAFNRYCRQQKIPTLHVYHGVMRVQPVHLAARWKVSIVSQFLFALGKIPKALRYVWPCYLQSLWRTGARLDEWLRFGADIIQGASGRYGVIGAKDAKTDRCCVLVTSDVDQAINKYGFRKEHVVAVGLPDLINFGLGTSQIGWNLVPQSGDRTDVMYVDGGFLFVGGVFSSAQDFVRHVVDTKDKLAAKGKRLIFKPHPDCTRSGLLRELEKQGVESCSNQKFVHRLQECCAAIVEISSASLIPALMGVPLLLANYGNLRTQEYGDILTSYPRAKFLTDLGAFDELLASEQSELDVDRTRQWILENAGPLPAEDMPQRVAQVTASLIYNS